MLVALVAGCSGRQKVDPRVASYEAFRSQQGTNQVPRPKAKPETVDAQIGAQVTEYRYQQSKNDGPRILTKYDEFRDTTVTSVSFRTGRILVGLLSISATKLPSRSLGVVLVLEQRSETWAHLGKTSLICLANGHRVKFDQAERKGTVLSGGVVERISTPLSLGELDSLAASSSVRCQLNWLEFEIPPEGLDAMKRFTKRITAEAEAAARGSTEGGSQ